MPRRYNLVNHERTKQAARILVFGAVGFMIARIVLPGDATLACCLLAGAMAIVAVKSSG